MNLRTKTILLFASMMLLFLGMSWWSQRNIIEDSLKDSILKGAESLSRSTAATISHFLDDKLRETKAIAAALPQSALISRDTVQIETRLKQMLDIFPSFENGFFLLSANGDLWVDYPRHPEARGRSFAYREYYRTTISKGQGVIGEPYLSSRSGQPVLTFTEILRDASGKVLGILGCSVQLNSAMTLGRIAEQKFGKSGYTYVFNRSRLMIFHPDENRILKRDVPKGANDLFDAAIEGFEGVGETINSCKIPMLLAVTAVRGTDWIVAVQQPMKEALAPLQIVRKRGGLAILLGAVAAALLGAVLIRRITLPLVLLNNAVSWLGRPVNNTHGGLVDESLDPRKELSRVSQSKDELGGLAQAFLAMDRKLTRHVNTLSGIATEWKRTFDAVDDALFIVDTSRIIIRLNRAAAQLVGLPFPEALGRPLQDLLVGANVDDKHSPLSWPTKDDQIKCVESTALVIEGDFEITGTLIADETGNTIGTIFVVHNLTERKAFEKTVRESSKMNALGTMAGGIAHDFNNILSAILGYAELINLHTKASHRQSSYAQEIIKAGRRGADLVQSLMTYSRKEVQQATCVDLNNLLLELENMIVRLMGEEIKVELKLDNRLVCIWGQKGQIEQVVINLAVNAKDAMPDGGIITISTFCNVNSSLGVSAEPNQVILKIQDTGKGMGAETAEKIFDPFYTTKSVGKGTGLGLSIVQGIVHSHAGEITVKSLPGNGTTFMVSLPLTEKTEELSLNRHPRELSTPVKIPKGSRVLLVDDDSAVREVNKTVLEGFGWDVICAEGPMEAISSLKKMQGKISLLITDIIMPVMNGYELAKTLQEICPTLKVIYLTGYSADVLQSKGMNSEELLVLEKPFSPMDLYEFINKAIVPQ